MPQTVSPQEGAASPAQSPEPAPPPEPLPPPLVPPRVGRIVLEPPPPPVPAPDPSVRRHDGFYLRLGLGAGTIAARIDSPAPYGKLNASGGGVGLEIALGGTVAEGLVIGGGLYVQAASQVRWKGDGLRSFTEGRTSLTGQEGGVSVLGVLVDYYPNPRDGFHVQGALGIGSLNFGRDSNRVPSEDWTGGGGGLMLGAGYEFWVAPQWSLGGLGRLLMVGGTLRGEDSSAEFDARGVALSLIVAATHH
ncbi:MAG TPA: hypothetical protein VFQ61_03405 [Polyangiaceae bacterium]|nr:hypothetical protein [Polyangiaceae bacterium]